MTRRSRKKREKREKRKRKRLSLFFVLCTILFNSSILVCFVTFYTAPLLWSFICNYAPSSPLTSPLLSTPLTSPPPFLQVRSLRQAACPWIQLNPCYYTSYPAPAPASAQIPQKQVNESSSSLLSSS